MEEEFYCIIKLVSGEEIFSLISTDENNGDPLIILQNPITIKMIESSQGVYIKVKSWSELSNDDIFIIKLDKVISMTETNDQHLIDVYNNYITDEEIGFNSYEGGKIKPSRKMGYLSSVEDARKSLENLYNLKDTKES